MSSKKQRKRQLDKHLSRQAIDVERISESDLSTSESDLSTSENLVNEPASRRFLILLTALLFPVTLWAYWPTFVWMEDQWRNEPDYSHGYLVFPLALALLYIRRDFFPRVDGSIYWLGFLPITAAVVIRVFGRIGYMDFLDGWTLVLWVGGITWVFGGWTVLRWALPSVVFLLLLVPLPFQAESLLSWRLQGVATTLSVASLQIMGFPAVSEGHTIWLQDRQLFVEEACSGLRIFVGMGAMGYLFAVLARRSWLDRVVILAAALPIAIIVNVFRVAGTTLAFHWLSESQAKIAHDFFGFVMIILGALLLAGVKLYWENLYRPVENSIDLRALAVGS